MTHRTLAVQPYAHQRILLHQPHCIPATTHRHRPCPALSLPPAAMRGEFDPPAFMENTERSSGLLLDSLTQFPAVYEFQLVVKQQAGQAQQEGQQQKEAQQEQAQQESPQALLQRYCKLVADTTAAVIPLESCTVKERLGGKYVSLCIPARVQAAAVIDLVFAALAEDPAVIMKF